MKLKPDSVSFFVRSFIAFLIFALSASTMFIGIRSSYAAASNGPIYLGEATASAVSSLLSYEGKQLKKISGKFTKEHIFKSTQAEHVVSKKQIGLAALTGGGIAQALAMAPGVKVSAVSGSAGGAMGRDTIIVNGVKAGYPWAGGTDIDHNAISFLFDGVPMMYMDTYDSAFDTMELPFANFFQGINVINGPGNPNGRWFNSLGGTVNFVPVQPSSGMYNKINMTYGSYNTYTLDDEMSTGFHNGWDGVLAAGYTHTETFLNTNWNAPDHAYAFYGKVVKLFNHNSFSLGAYAVRYKDYAFSEGIPVNPIPGVNVEGYGIPNAPAYSQSTSGFYSTLSKHNWYKYVRNQALLIYSKLNLKFSKRLTFHSMVWYMHAHRFHYMLDYYGDTPEGIADGFGIAEEWYSVPTDIMGEKLSLDYRLTNNDIKVGEYYMWGTFPDLYDGGEYQKAPFYPPTLGYSAFVGNNRYLSSYIQDAIKPIKNLTITPGLDYVGFQNNFFQNTASIYYPALNAQYPQHNYNAKLSNVSKNFYKLEPSLGINYKLTKNISLFGNWAISYQNPVDTTFNISNEDFNMLSPIRSEGLEAGVRFLIKNYGYLHNFVLNADYYQTVFSNEDVVAEQTYFLTGKISFSKAKNLAKGINIYAEDDPIRNLHIFTDIGLTDSRVINYKTGNVSYNGYHDANSPDTLNVGIFYNIPENKSIYTVKLWDNYTGSQYLWSYEYGSGEPTKNKMPGNNLLNLSIGLKTVALNNFIPGLKNMKISLSIDNLLNKKYNSQEVYNTGGSSSNVYNYYKTGALLQAYPGAPRMFFLSTSMKF